MLQLPVVLIVKEVVPLCRIVPFVPIVTFPETVNPLDMDNTQFVVPVPIVNDLATAVAVMDGWLVPVKLASPMITSSVAVGIPAVQLVVLAQAVLTVPFQEVCASTFAAMRNRQQKASFDTIFKYL